MSLSHVLIDDHVRLFERRDAHRVVAAVPRELDVLQDFEQPWDFLPLNQRTLAERKRKLTIAREEENDGK